MSVGKGISLEFIRILDASQSGCRFAAAAESLHRGPQWMLVHGQGNRKHITCMSLIQLPYDRSKLSDSKVLFQLTCSSVLRVMNKRRYIVVGRQSL